MFWKNICANAANVPQAGAAATKLELQLHSEAILELSILRQVGACEKGRGFEGGPDLRHGSGMVLPQLRDTAVDSAGGPRMGCTATAPVL